MKITKITIRSFGALVDREFEFSPGANVIEGQNESGKTSLALFIKFMLYGLDGKKGNPTEKERFINWQTHRADGVMEFTHEGRSYRLERTVGEGVRESKRLTDMESLSPVKFDGEVGEYLLGVPESVFLNTVFVRQSAGSAVDSDAVRNAVANILSSADENISVERITKKLDAARTKLKHKNSVGGRLRELERQIAQTENELAASLDSHKNVISAQSDLQEKRSAIDSLSAENERLSLTLSLYDGICRLGQRERMRRTLEQLEEKKVRLGSLNRPDAAVHSEIAGIRARIKAAKNSAALAEDELSALGKWQVPRFTSEECDDDSAAATRLAKSAHGARVPAIILMILGVLALIGGAICMYAELAPFAALIAAMLGGAVMCALSVALLARSAGSKRKLRAILERWGVDDVDALSAAIAAEREVIASERSHSDELSRASTRLKSAEEELEEAQRAAIALCSGVAYSDSETHVSTSESDTSDGEASDTDAARAEALLSAFEQRCLDAEQEFSALEGEYKELLGRCGEMEKNLRDVDFDAIDALIAQHSSSAEYSLAASMDEAGCAAAEKKLRFNREKLRALEAQCDSLKRTAYSSPGHAPAQLEEELAALRREHADGELRLEALELAMETVAKCSEGLRQNLIPQIAERASADFAKATAGRHDRLALGEDFSLQCSGEDGVFSADCLSSGGADAAYVCLRRSLTPALFRTEAPCAIYDESFSSIDEERTLRLISLIAADPGQSLIFTCRRSDAEYIARELSPTVNVIRM